MNLRIKAVQHRAIEAARAAGVVAARVETKVNGRNEAVVAIILPDAHASAASALQVPAAKAASDSSCVGARIRTKTTERGEVVVAIILPAEYTPLTLVDRRPPK